MMVSQSDPPNISRLNDLSYYSESSQSQSPSSPEEKPFDLFDNPQLDSPHAYHEVPVPSIWDLNFDLNDDLAGNAFKIENAQPVEHLVQEQRPSTEQPSCEPNMSLLADCEAKALAEVENVRPGKRPREDVSEDHTAKIFITQISSVEQKTELVHEGVNLDSATYHQSPGNPVYYQVVDHVSPSGSNDSGFVSPQPQNSSEEYDGQFDQQINENENYAFENLIFVPSVTEDFRDEIPIETGIDEYSRIQDTITENLGTQGDVTEYIATQVPGTEIATQVCGTECLAVRTPVTELTASQSSVTESHATQSPAIDHILTEDPTSGSAKTQNIEASDSGIEDANKENQVRVPISVLL